MANKRPKPEEIVTKLRQVEVLQGQGATIADERLLRNAGSVDLIVGGKSCDFGRYCGALQIDGVNFGERLVEEGLARRSENYDWCQGA